MHRPIEFEVLWRALVAAVADHRLERHYAEHQSVSPRRMLTGVRLLAIVVVHFEG